MNYEEQGRTNYFKVKDKSALEEYAEKAQVVIDWEEDKAALFADFGFQFQYEDEDTGEVEDLDIVESAKEFLADGEVLVLQSCGREGQRYVAGWTMACNNKGEMVSFDLDDIYEKAAQHFKVDLRSIGQAKPE